MLIRLLLMFVFALSIPLAAQQIKYTDGKDSWNPDILGNHRAVLVFSGKGDVAKTTIEWRRRDQNPELKKIIVQDATGKEIGYVTSGTQAPSLGKAIGLGYVTKENATLDNEIFISIRDKGLKAQVVKTPFYKG